MSNFSDSKTFDFSIYTPASVYLTSKVKSVTVPSVTGPFQVLVNHAPIIAAMDKGIVKVVDENNNEDSYMINSGITELHHNQLTLAVSNIEKIN